MSRKQTPQLPPVDEEIAQQIRNMQVWQAQAIALLKRALRNPGLTQETVLDIGPKLEVHLMVVATERAKLILPESAREEDDDL